MLYEVITLDFVGAVNHVVVGEDIPPGGVITSYSIHYTKLYEKTVVMPMLRVVIW